MNLVRRVPVFRGAVCGAVAIVILLTTGTSGPVHSSPSIPLAETLPVTTIPDVSIPAATLPSSSVPLTTVPLTTVPAASVPLTTVPATSVPSSTTPRAVDYSDPTLAPVCGVPRGNGCRLIAYYGTPLSTRMGVLGATGPQRMLPSLTAQTARWQSADPKVPTRCALELITVIAQAAPGASGLYRSRTSPEIIKRVLGWARSAGCLLILDVQVGWSDVVSELPPLLPFLAEPDVHLALDPEWDMQPGVKPGTRIGTMSAADINLAIDALHQLVVERKLPPKLLVIHRFRPFMVTDPQTIKTGSTVRLVANMDGFGPPAQKINGYAVARRGIPTELGGFKLFFKNDKPLLEPEDLVPTGVVTPPPVFLNYQ
jgi:hypothetical protein